MLLLFAITIQQQSAFVQAEAPVLLKYQSSILQNIFQICTFV